MKKGGWMLVLVLIGLISFWLWMKGERVANVGNTSGYTRERVTPAEKPDPAATDERGGLNRQAASLIYSKHARCRMGCRHISEEEVKDILHHGRINYGKSDMRGSPDPKYAIEGGTKDGQEVRIIFANSPRGIVVVTVIDLENEWKCNCK
jgi:hypothetical protein